MAYRDSGAQLLSRILELEATLDGLRPRIDALEAAVSRLEVNVAVGRAPLDRDQALAADELRDKALAEQVGHLALRVAQVERNLALTPPPKQSDDDLRALVAAELPRSKGRRRR